MIPSRGRWFAPFELDHFFVAVETPESGLEEVEGAGFLTSPSHPHPGQGTASRGILFENAYLEFIWLTDPSEAKTPAIRRTRLSQRLEPGAGSCPFGIGLRTSGEDSPELPFQTWVYRPPYLPEGLFFRMSNDSENVNEPLVFYMPWLSGPSRPSAGHPNGAQRVTNLAIVLGEQALRSETVMGLAGAGVASFRWGAEYFMEVELDEGRGGETLDLRPEIPLRLVW